MIYFDTSYLVRLYFEDRGWPDVRKLAATDTIACSAHGQPEVIAAFHRKFREGAITAGGYAALLGQWQVHDEAGAFQWLPQSPDILRRIRLVYATLPRNVYLRAADALHLGAAAVHGLKAVYTNDTHLLAAADFFGVNGVNVISDR